MWQAGQRQRSLMVNHAPVRGHRPEMEGARVLLLMRRFKGEEVIYVGRDSIGDFWAASPDCTSEILSLAFETDFALVFDLSSDPNRN